MTTAEIATLRKKAEEDLARVDTEEGLIASEKEPFSALFGRDILITSLFLLEDYKHKPNPEILDIVSRNLSILAVNQGTKVDPETEEEPGKIEHENRSGPINQLRLKQLRSGGWPVKSTERQLYMRYWGSVDATPLFIAVASEYIRVSNDWNFFDQYKNNIKAAISWMENYGDIDRDGFIEYQAKNRKALINQGWKDSGDSILTEDGKHPKEPLALVEVQGYAFWAYTQAAWLFEMREDYQFANYLRMKAADLRQKFNRDFWIEDEQFFAYALDGDKNQIKDIVSNVGHLLVTGILDKNRAHAVVRRFMEPDMLTKYGIRTLSTNSPHFRFSETDPQIQAEAYHKGPVWPHDNAIIALGFEKYGFCSEAEKVKEANLAAISELGHVELSQVTPDGLRLVPYERAAKPQTWVIGSALLWTYQE
jgi:glycogen debranching enzyme